MSAYKDLEALLGGTPLARKAIDAALAEYAHELAEKQRAWARQPGVVVRVEVPELLDSIVRAAVDCAADEIDPEVSNSGG